MHGVDERISVETMGEALECTVGIVRALAALKASKPR